MRRLFLVTPDGRTEQSDLLAVLGGKDALPYQPVWCHSVAEFGASLTPHDLVLIVVNDETAQFVEWLGGHRVPAPIFAILPEEAAETLLQPISRIADDFIVAPFGPLELRHRVHRLAAHPPGEVESARHCLIDEMGLPRLVGCHPVFVDAISQLPRFARTEASVCITGETGTGKELCARALHHLSQRQRFPFIAVDCGALPDQLFENEIFGHARGAFTDAHRDQKGLIAMADGGTLFLDEIDALSLSAQAKLLRFLQEHTYRPLGSDRFEPANVRVIAATNRDLEDVVRKKQFRADLYFRLNVLRLRLPPLRERSGDIELLAYAALKEFGAPGDSALKIISPAALRVLMLHDWPGNVRELYTCEEAHILP